MCIRDSLWSRAYPYDHFPSTALIIDGEGNPVFCGTLNGRAIRIGKRLTADPDLNGTFLHFVAKHDPNGNLLWSTTFGNIWAPMPALCADIDSNLFMYFGFEDIRVLGNRPGSGRALIKLSPSGEVLFSKFEG